MLDAGCCRCRRGYAGRLVALQAVPEEKNQIDAKEKNVLSLGLNS